MKKTLLMVLAALMLPGIVSAKSLAQFSEADMGNMMQKMAEMQKCMEQLDQAKLETLSARAEQDMEKVKSLCRAGKRDEAQKEALRISSEFMQEPEMIKMRKCGEIAKGALPESMFEFDEKELEQKNICD